MDKIEILLEQSKQILHEVEENITIQEGWKTGMKVAVGYLIDFAYLRLFELRLNDQEFEVRTSKDSHNLFDCAIMFDQNDVVAKQLERLKEFFITLPQK